MQSFKFIPAVVCTCVCTFVSGLQGQNVTLGTWLQEGTGSVTGAGDTFTATPTASGIVDNGDNFGERNAARHRVYQTFDAVDFSADGHKSWSCSMSPLPVHRKRWILASRVIGRYQHQPRFFPIAWDVVNRAGSYNRTRFVDNLDGATGDAHAGAFIDAINGSGTIATASAAPTEANGATAQGLVAENTVSFQVIFTRNAGDSFSFTTNATEADGDVVYAETAGSYDPVNPTSGDTEVANIAVNSFDGIVFGLFDDDPFPGSGSYTVSGIAIAEVPAKCCWGMSIGAVRSDFLDIAPFIATLSGIQVM